MKRTLFLLMALVGCHPAEPHWDFYCVRSRTEPSMAIGMDGKVGVVFVSQCMHEDSTFHVPARD